MNADTATRPTSSTDGIGGRSDDLPPVLLVHGAWHGPWCFAPLLGALSERGLDAATVALQTDAPGGPQALMETYCAEVAAAVAECARPPIVLGHSMAGAVLTQLASAPDTPVAGFIFLAAYVPAPGQCIMDDAKADAGSEIGAAMLVGPDKHAILNPAVVGPLLYGDAAADARTGYIKHLRPQNTAIFKACAAADIAGSAIPRAYIVCGRDRAIGPACQRNMAARAGCAPVIELDADHSPFVTQTQTCADAVANAVAALCP